MISHTNNNESYILNTSNSDNIILTSNLPCINIQNDISFNTFISLQKVTYSESSDNINDEITNQINTSEESLSNKNLAEFFDHTCDDNGIILLNIKEETDVMSIYSINATNHISMNYDENSIPEYYAPFLLSKNYEDLFSGSYYDSTKQRYRRQKT